jgi:light-regulated signal transduction histidine kinase (bacteriophytochrome)
LRSIDGFSLALLEDYDDKLDEGGRDHLRQKRTGTQKMAHLIDDILKLSRITRCELTLTRRTPNDNTT